jgi:hypothetical protein
LIVLILVVACHVGEPSLRRRGDHVPGADLQSLGVAPAQEQTVRAVYEDWRRVCQWVAENTQRGDVFLTPRQQQTFKWRTGRAEVATWKDVPQEAGAIVQWWRRLQDIDGGGGDPRGSGSLAGQRVAELARKYGAEYVIVDRSTARPTASIRVYPAGSEWNDSYAVYRAARLVSGGRSKSP